MEPSNEAVAMLHPELLWWLVILLGGGVISLIVYIFLDKNSKNDNALHSLEISLTNAVTKLEQSITKLNNTLESLKDEVFTEIDMLKVNIHKIDIRVKAIETVCKERARHCPVYGARFAHTRTGEPLAFHQRTDDYPDGSEDR